jgi:hypothetical protein
MARRRGIKLTTISRKLRIQSELLSINSSAISGKMGGPHEATSHPVHGKKVEIPVEDPDKPSTDLRPQPKGIIRKLKYLPGKVRNFWRILRPKLTPDELEVHDYLELEKRRDKACMQEGRRYGRIASSKLALLSNPGQNDTRNLKLVRWKMITRDEAFTKIILIMDLNPKHVPDYMLISKLPRDPLYTDDLAVAIGLPVHWDVGDFGVTLTIFRPVEKPIIRKKITVEDLISSE